MDRSNAHVVLSQLPGAFTHFHEVHPHAAIAYQSPRLFRRQLARQAGKNGAN
jgi:putative transposase